MSSSDSQKEGLGTSDGENEEVIRERGQEQTSQSDQELVLVESNARKEADLANFGDIVYEGMMFESEEEAYEKYNELARKMGFSVRKSKTYRRADGSVRCRMFVCFRQGFRAKDSRYPYVKKERKGLRTGCMARMMIKNERPDEWIVSELVFEHNHPLEDPEKTFTLRSHRKVEDGVKGEKSDIVGFQPAENFDSMSQHIQEHEPADTPHVDCESYLQKRRREELGPDGASEILEYFTKKQLENPTFFNATMVDDENEMTNFFWSDAMSIIDYNHFGDVVVLDTTYRTSKFSRPFALFAGVNHQKQTVVFGSALLIDESIESFVWLFDTWMKAMSGKKPKTILTDQCPEIAKAVSLVLPETRHRLCLWQIFQNGVKHLSQLYWNPDFRQVFKRCLYNYETEEEFLSGWEKMLQNYKLVKNRWLLDLFKVRQDWALVYGRDTFCADMTSPHRGKSINRFLKNFVKRKYSVAIFLSCYESAIASKRHKELDEECESMKRTPDLIVPTPMLKQAAEKYTRAVYDMFETEYKEHLMCKIEDCGVNGMICKFEITQEGHAKGCVTIDPSSCQVVCSCKKFEFVGILCHHIIKVLYHKNIHDIPSRYILKRWTKDAKTEVAKEQDSDLVQAVGNAARMMRYNQLLRKAVSVATKGSMNENVHLVAKRILDNGLKEVEDAYVTCSHNAPEVEMLTINGLEDCQRKKKTWTKLVESTDNMDHPQNKKTKKGDRLPVHNEFSGPSIDSNCSQWVTPASAFEIPGFDSYPNLPYISNQYARGSSPPAYQPSSFTNVSSNSSHNHLLHQVAFLSREPQLLANLFPQPHSTTTNVPESSRHTNSQPDSCTFTFESSKELSHLGETELSPDRNLTNNHNAEMN
ncbi:hypothetical protein ACHQM5_007099 [Ranunculus cassubicifolius]